MCQTSWIFITVEKPARACVCVCVSPDEHVSEDSKVTVLAVLH